MVEINFLSRPEEVALIIDILYLSFSHTVLMLFLFYLVWWY